MHAHMLQHTEYHASMPAGGGSQLCKRLHAEQVQCNRCDSLSDQGDATGGCTLRWDCANLSEMTGASARSTGAFTASSLGGLPASKPV